MGREPDDTAVERLLAERGRHLMRAGVALTGSRTDDEDLLQAALERLLQNQRRVDTDLGDTCGAPSTISPPTAGGAVVGGGAGSPSSGRSRARRGPATSGTARPPAW